MVDATRAVAFQRDAGFGDKEMTIGGPGLPAKADARFAFSMGRKEGYAASPLTDDACAGTFCYWGDVPGSINFSAR
jgi:hypothetical protein